MAPLSQLELKIQNARDEIRGLRQAIARQRTAVARAGQDAGDPQLRARITAQRVDDLREIEDETLGKLTALPVIERVTRAVLAGALGAALTNAERVRSFPKDATRLSGQLRLLVQLLRSVGVWVGFDRCGRGRGVTLDRNDLPY
jgi:hypothetical protein